MKTSPPEPFHLTAQDLEISPYDAIDYMEDEQAIQALIEAALEDGDPALIASTMRDAARARSVNRLTQTTGLDRQVVCAFFAAKETTPATATKEQAKVLAHAMMETPA